jgi:nucleoside phosphorylase
VIKNSAVRDRLGKEFKAKCVEMEAAGLMNDFPCLVIRGVYDYADAHKNDVWHRYAATTAAAYAKEFLSIVPPQAVL